MAISKALFHAAIFGVLVGLLTASAAAQDFQKAYRIGQGGSVRVHNVSGDVNIRGYDGDQITVAGFREGRDANLLSVEDLSQGNGVEVRAKYPEHCNCDASIRFEVQVPRSISYSFDHISTASGNVHV